VGQATYTWGDGTKEVSTFDERGIKHGPAKLVKPDESVEERQYVDGKKSGKVRKEGIGPLKLTVLKRPF